MKKFAFLLLLSLLLCKRAGAQCPENVSTVDAREVYIDFNLGQNLPGNLPNFEITMCDQHNLHNQVLFLPKFRGDGYSNGTYQVYSFWCDPGDGTPEFEFKHNEVVSHTYPLNSTAAPQKYTLSIKLRYINGTNIDVKDFEFQVKQTASASSSGYTPPDEVWELQSSIPFTPPVPGAFPAGSLYNISGTGSAHAYVKLAPTHAGKLIKPLIFSAARGVFTACNSIARFFLPQVQ